MGAAASYFRHIKETIGTVFEGMAVSASHLMRKPYTIQYPDRTPTRVQDTLPFRYRGILDVDLEICTGCLACDRACPIDCIAIAIEKNAQTREIVISQFDIDIAKCMFCGLCSEPCPTGAIHHTTEFEGADFALESLIRRFVPEPIVAYKAKKGPESDAAVAKLLERGMTYVDEWAQPGSDTPPKPATTAGKPAAPRPVPKPAAPAGAKPAPATAQADVTPTTHVEEGTAAASVQSSSGATAPPEEKSVAASTPHAEGTAAPDAKPDDDPSDRT